MVNEVQLFNLVFQLIILKYNRNKQKNYKRGNKGCMKTLQKLMKKLIKSKKWSRKSRLKNMKYF
jgi:hypothetical protein